MHTVVIICILLLPETDCPLLPRSLPPSLPSSLPLYQQDDMVVLEVDIEISLIA